MKALTVKLHQPTLLCLVLFVVCGSTLTACQRAEFNDREKDILTSLSLDRLSPPRSLSNRVALDPDAQNFGAELFFDTKLSSNGQISCATCHQPDKAFTDGKPVGIGLGDTTRNTPSLNGAAWQVWQYWDGRRDSLWSQALTPLEAEKEMGGNRTAIAKLIASEEPYRTQYENIFGTLPFGKTDAVLDTNATPFGDKTQKRSWIEMDRANQNNINIVFSNIGKALGAYQHTLAPVKTRFDLFQQEVTAGTGANDIKSISKLELEGARLFLNAEKTQCLECHNGPLLSNRLFHNIATGNFIGPVYDFGREFGSQAVLLDEFNCQGRYSDSDADDCAHLIHMNRDTVHMRGAFKTPSLRNITNTAPYFHDGRFATLEAVMQYYANPPAWDKPDAHELRPGFELTKKEVKAMTAFLQTFEPAE